MVGPLQCQTSIAESGTMSLVSEGSVVPESIQSAERWRLVGEKLRAHAPELYRQMFALLVLSIPDGDAEKITESCFTT